MYMQGIYVFVSSKKTCNSKGTSVVVWMDHSGKEPHKQVGVDSIVTSGNLGGVMVSKGAWNARDVVSIPVLGIIFAMFITPTACMCVYKIQQPEAS